MAIIRPVAITATHVAIELCSRVLSLGVNIEERGSVSLTPLVGLRVGGDSLQVAVTELTLHVITVLRADFPGLICAVDDDRS